MSEIAMLADFLMECHEKAFKREDKNVPLWRRVAEEVMKADKDIYNILPKFHKTRGTKERNTKALVQIPGMMRTVDVMRYLNMSEQQVRWARKKNLIPLPARGGGAGFNLYWREADIKAIPPWHIERIKNGYFSGNKLHNGLPTYEAILSAEQSEGASQLTTS